MHTNQIWETDKRTVSMWMRENCHGFRNAKTRSDILPNIRFINCLAPQTKDRYFRKIVAELKHEGNIYSCAERGYWFAPLNTTDQEEIREMLSSLAEEKSKAMDILSGLDRRIRSVESLRSGQMAFGI